MTRCARAWRRALLVLAKAPEPGRVKTRLCPPLTPAEAADLAAAALLDTLDAVRAVPGGRCVVALAGRLVRGGSRGRVGRRAARRRDPRASAVRTSGTASRPRTATPPACCPAARCCSSGWTPRRSTRPCSPRPPHRCTAAPSTPSLGPAADGGWWALGLRDPRAAAAIADVPTSRDDTGERTVHALRAAGLRVGLLPELTDVDTAADAVAVARTAPGTRFAGRRASPALPGACPRRIRRIRTDSRVGAALTG